MSRWTMTLELDSPEVQLIALALAELGLRRPGWDDMLSRLAGKFDAELYAGFKETSRGAVRPEEETHPL